jgi:O-acetyl-ADP-ribose deacetylase (regulator of RNase III)
MEMPMDSRIALHVGDITRLPVDAIVNAANSQLEAGGGVCGAIHRAAGPELLAECRAVGPCPTGEARITKGYRLPARWVIHAVGPVWQGGKSGEDGLLEAAYRNSLALGERYGARTIAFPAISTGIFGYPLERATDIAVRTVRTYLQAHPALERVTLMCFDERTAQVYRRILEQAVA